MTAPSVLFGSWCINLLLRCCLTLFGPAVRSRLATELARNVDIPPTVHTHHISAQAAGACKIAKRLRRRCRSLYNLDLTAPTELYRHIARLFRRSPRTKCPFVCFSAIFSRLIHIAIAVYEKRYFVISSSLSNGFMLFSTSGCMEQGGSFEFYLG